MMADRFVHDNYVFVIKSCPSPSKKVGGTAGFTLIELLVVVSIIVLLISIMLPSLRRARDQSKLAVCASNLKQIGTGIHLYANEYDGYIPRGPVAVDEFDFGGNNLATNQLWHGDGTSFTSMNHPLEYTALGQLYVTTVPQPRLYFCPADDGFNLREEMPKIATDEDAFGSYQYRQLDHLPENAAGGRLDRMGENLIDERRVRVEALALDTNSLGPWGFPPYQSPGSLRQRPLSRFLRPDLSQS